MRATDLEVQLRQRDWAALEQLSLMWRQGQIPSERVLEILALILPAPDEIRLPCAPLPLGMCIVRCED